MLNYGKKYILDVSTNLYKNMKKKLIDEFIKRDLLFIAKTLDKKNWFILKNGTASPIFLDMTKFSTLPDLFQQVIKYIMQTIKDERITFDEGPCVGSMSDGYCFVHYFGEIICWEGPTDKKKYQVQLNKLLDLKWQNLGISVRHYLDKAKDYVIEWRKQNPKESIMGKYF